MKDDKHDGYAKDADIKYPEFTAEGFTAEDSSPGDEIEVLAKIKLKDDGKTMCLVSIDGVKAHRIGDDQEDEDEPSDMDDEAFSLAIMQQPTV